jgi:hypothetical protein
MVFRSIARHKIKSGVVLITLLIATGFIVGIPVSYDKLPRGPDPAPETAQRTVLRSGDEWERWWRASTRNRYRSLPSTPSIEFKNTMIVVVAMGSCGSSGYGTRVMGIFENPFWVNVFFSESEPGWGDVVLGEITYPHHAVRLRMSSKPVLFVNMTRVFWWGLVPFVGIAILCLWAIFRSRRVAKSPGKSSSGAPPLPSSNSSPGRTQYKMRQ